MWCGTVILLHHNTKRVGKIKFWLLVALPLIAFYFAYVSAYNELYQIGSVINSKQTDLVKMFLIIALATLCGILYGIGFRSVGMLVSSKEVREYMIITGYGIVLYFIAANSTVAAAGFPPFGLVSISFVPTAAFLILLGLYHSAISVAHDARLRREVKTSTINETRLLGSIGTAQMQQEIETRVMRLTKDKADMITEYSGVEPSLSESEIKQHLHDVLNEIKWKGQNTESKGSVKHDDKTG
jgi:hypothetical protein